MNFIKISLRDSKMETPEVRAWLDKQEKEMDKVYIKLIDNLVIYGTAMIKDGEIVQPRDYFTSEEDKK